MRSPFVLVGGDLNDTPDSAPLAELLKAGFRDVVGPCRLPHGSAGNLWDRLANNKIDYLISSQELWATVQTCAVERRGTYHPA